MAGRTVAFRGAVSGYRGDVGGQEVANKGSAHTWPGRMAGAGRSFRLVRAARGPYAALASPPPTARRLPPAPAARHTSKGRTGP
ncbi:hypothetical protein TPA0598_04_02080 [Streptomyces lydicamycinicus]|uniref:Uncharacterized protein n=1 Tax=Streptomyces lydicamycinicus TaxID=1546107 RepID=A0A0P4R6L9_9ACTN|nr:hypothetical protein TPA0598_04_02080 [Streptomyces lydicamycinicus]